MRNIRLVIEYDGTNFAGWQEQRTKTKAQCLPTIQACLREAIHKVTGEWVTVYGASRTDAGVHALGQVANFKTSSRLSAKRLVPALNYYLPREIVVRSAEEVPEEFHSQYNARSKVYRYTILNDPLPRAIDRNLYYHYPWPLNVERMREAAQCLLGKHDFRAFCVEAHNKENTVRTIKSFEIVREGLPAIYGNSSYLHFVVEADGFLHKMIRGIVGTLLLVGSGKMGPKEFKEVLEARNRRLAGPTVPARGLCLLKVNYEENGTWPGQPT
jgi:tRNA pseudouridine38-40 synthase